MPSPAADTLIAMSRPRLLAVAAVLFALLAVGCGGESPQTIAKPTQQAVQAAQSEQSRQDSQGGSAQSPTDAQERETSQPAEQPEPAAVAEPPQDAAQPARQSNAVSDTADASEQQTEAQPDSAQDAADDIEQEAPPANKFTLGGERPATLVVPAHADLSAPRPLIVLLHGFGSNAGEADQYFRFSDWMDERGFGVLYPNGTVDAIGAQHWNATDECCDLFNVEVDDVGYIKSLIAEAGEYAVFDQVFVVGHSNGGFMAYRLACEEVPGLAGIVSLAGAAHSEPSSCRAPSPLSVLQIHGTEDELVLYGGGRLPTHPDPERKPTPSAWESVTRWAERAGCDLSAVVELPKLDTDLAVEGDETAVKRYERDCANRSVMELWTIEGGGHVPLVWGTDFTPGILDWIAERYAPAEPAAAMIEERIIGGERTARLLFPTNRAADAEDRALPLVLSLHGYSGEASAHDWYFGLSARIAEYDFALITPQGTVDARGSSFWNATDGCCNFHGSDVDDYGWLSGLVAEARQMIEVDGVYAVGYSNGGFMAYRLACDGLDGLVAIASLAGSSFGDAARCEHAAPVSVLQIHGTADRDIPYAGTLEYAGGYPGAVELIQRWARRAGCDPERVEQLPSLDLDANLPGAETQVPRIREGCLDGITVELWTIDDADHLPFFADDWPDHLLDWLFNESRTN